LAGWVGSDTARCCIRCNRSTIKHISESTSSGSVLRTVARRRNVAHGSVVSFVEACMVCACMARNDVLDILCWTGRRAQQLS